MRERGIYKLAAVVTLLALSRLGYPERRNTVILLAGGLTPHTSPKAFAGSGLQHILDFLEAVGTPSATSHSNQVLYVTPSATGGRSLRELPHIPQFTKDK